ncbi:response regulator transcription factor [Ruania zhangjianzhongii]|uniref:response regulator transcription factor n=1 Tax=Ruania zhangjianzhongii TaxID=2603206 RepID=UPI002467AF3E|nr:response regulator transcription factor [Ruania zhangjianzhongii]
MTPGSQGPPPGSGGPPAERRIRVLIADDEPLVRGGVRAILATDPQIEVVGEAGDGHEAVAAVAATRPTVALLDIRMPRLDGLGACQEILRLVPETKVVILTTFGEDAYISDALTAGASGFLLKASDPRELLDAVRAVADGAAYLSPRVAHRVIGALRGGPAPSPDATERIAGLTDREREVLTLVGAGSSNAEIARRLYLTEGTVKGYVSAILAKVGADNRVKAAILAYEAGLR